LGGRDNEIIIEKAAETVRAALRLGVNFIDTAPLYGHNYSEHIIGYALQNWPEQIYLATKVGMLACGRSDYTRDGVWRSFESSLRRLRRDKIELLQIHEAEIAGWDQIFRPGGIMQALQELKSQGLIEGIGITGADLHLLSRALETGEFDSVLTYNKYDLVTQQAKKHLIPTAAARDVAVVLGSPLHMGLLGSLREKLVQKRPEFVTEEMIRKLDSVEQMAAEYGESLPHFALRYLLSDPDIATVIPATTKPERIMGNVAVSDGTRLPPDLIREIEQL